MKIRFQGCFLYINGNNILLSHNIYGLVELDDLVVVLTYASSAKQMETLPTNNVYAFDENGEEVWQIEEPPQSSDTVVSFADISLKGSGDVVVGTTRGTEYVVNITDGSIAPLTGRRPW